MEPAYKSGYESYLHNKEKYHNPYERGANEYNLFERGWSQALKRNFEKVRETSGLNWNDEPKSLSRKETTAEAYANRRG